MSEPKLTELQRDMLLYVNKLDGFACGDPVGGGTIGELWSLGLVKPRFDITPAGRKLAETLRKERDE